MNNRKYILPWNDLGYKTVIKKVCKKLISKQINANRISRIESKYFLLEIPNDMQLPTTGWGVTPYYIIV